MDEYFKGIDPVLLARFKRYYRKHPKVYEKFKQYASEMLGKGRSKYSAWTIINLIRWHHDLESDEEFKISNDYIALYARLLMYHDQKFKGFFNIKRMKTSDRKFTHEAPREVANV